MKQPQTTRVLAVISAHPGLTYDGILEMLDFVPTNLKQCLANMSEKRRIVNSSPSGQPGVWWTPDAAPERAKKTPRLTTPKNGPGYTASNKVTSITFDKSTTLPVRNSTTTEHYTQGMWAVARPEGLAHTLCPSREGDRLIPYTGRALALAGVLKDRQGLGAR